MPVTINFQKLGAEVFKEYILVGGIPEVEGETLSPQEEKAVLAGVEFGRRIYERISPKLAVLFDRYAPLVLEAAKIYKRIALRAQVAAEFAWPPQLDKLAAVPIAPQLIRYVASPSDNDPAFSDYQLNTFKISFTTPGETKYLFGSSNKYWRGISATRGPIMHVIFKDGLIEIGTSPKVDQVYIEFEGWDMLGTVFQPEVVKIPIETDRPVYQYGLPGPIVVMADRGFRMAVMGESAGDSIIVPVGISFYYVSKFKNLTWIS
mgnify:CR=1 FL=1